MGFLEDKCRISVLNEEVIKRCKPFNCGNEDIDSFFQHDTSYYQNQFLGKSYCFLLEDDPSVIVCAFTISNDSLRMDMLPNNRKKIILKEIPHSKHMQRYPGTLIGRLGVNKDFSNRGIGTEVMSFIKEWLIDDNYKTGCRYLIVDATNEIVTLNYYMKNNFKFVFNGEKQEIEFSNRKRTELHTRLMYYDLANWAYRK